jgi:hypothetical protein
MPLEMRYPIPSFHLYVLAFLEAFSGEDFKSYNPITNRIRSIGIGVLCHLDY